MIGLFKKKKRFFKISIKEDISPKEKESQGLLYTGGAQRELLYSPQPDVRLEKPSVLFRMQNKPHKRELSPQVLLRMGKGIIE